MEVLAAAPRPASPSVTEDMYSDAASSKSGDANSSDVYIPGDFLMIPAQAAPKSSISDPPSIPSTVFRGVGRDLMAAEQGHDAAAPNTLEQLLKRIKALEQEVQMQKQEVQMQANHARDLDYKHSQDLDAEKQRRVDQALRLDTERKIRVGMFMLRVRVNKKVQDRAHVNFLKRQEAATTVNKLARGFLARLQFQYNRRKVIKLQTLQRINKAKTRAGVLRHERDVNKATKIQASIRGALALQPERLKTLRRQKQQLGVLLTTTTNDRDALRRENDRMRLRHDREVEALQQRNATLVEEKSGLEEQLDPFCCPITRQVPDDPVICAVDGQTYEGTEIKHWVQQHGTSPMTREQVTAHDLVTVRQFRVLARSRSTGANIAELKASGMGVDQAVHHGFSTRQLMVAGFTAQELKDTGFTARQIKGAGFNAQALKDAGFSASELKDAGCNARTLKDAGCIVQELKDAGFNAQELKDAAFTVQELKGAGFSAHELKDAVFTAEELKDAGFSAPELLNAGFTFQDLQAASQSFTDPELQAAVVQELQAGGVRANHFETLLVEGLKDPIESLEGGWYYRIRSTDEVVRQRAYHSDSHDEPVAGPYDGTKAKGLLQILRDAFPGSSPLYVRWSISVSRPVFSRSPRESGSGKRKPSEA